MKSEIVIYQADELSEHIEVRLDEDKETFWLTQEQIAQLFERDRTVITKHLKNIFKEGELEEEVVCALFAHTTQHGAIKGKTQSKEVKHYNLDAILSVGYRVNSKRGTQFRIWASKVLKTYLMKGYALNNRINRIEDTIDSLSKKIDTIDFQIKSHQLPTQGVFYDGQVFDAYEFISKIIRSATKHIVLIDNYIDESTLMHLSKKREDVSILLLTKTVNKTLQLDIQRVNSQYGNFRVQSFNQSHDRFLIIDSKEVYHLGASLKDLGKKWFAFSKLETKSIEGILEKIKVNTV